MKIAAMVAMAAVGLNARAEQRITVYVDNDAAPSLVLQLAEVRAAAMFLTSEVRIEWRGHAPDRGPLPSGAIAVSLAPESPTGFLPSALAFTRPYEGIHITVFWDRIQQTPRSAPAAVVLAHVLVHEITHVLQGIDRHSETGVMKAQWTNGDYAAMAWKPLPFAPEDIRLMHAGREE